MTLTKKKMISEIGRRTRLKNRDIQAMLETLVEVWTEELVSGGRIELENFFVIESRIFEAGDISGKKFDAYQRLHLRVSRSLRKKLGVKCRVERQPE